MKNKDQIIADMCYTAHILLDRIESIVHNIVDNIKKNG